MNDEYLVKRCAAGQNLQAGTTLAPVWWRGEQNDAVGRHTEVVWLLGVADELLFVFGVDGLSATAV